LLAAPLEAAPLDGRYKVVTSLGGDPEQ